MPLNSLDNLVETRRPLAEVPWGVLANLDFNISMV